MLSLQSPCLSGLKSMPKVLLAELYHRPTLRSSGYTLIANIDLQSERQVWQWNCWLVPMADFENVWSVQNLWTSWKHTLHDNNTVHKRTQLRNKASTKSGSRIPIAHEHRVSENITDWKDKCIWRQARNHGRQPENFKSTFSC